MKILRYDAGSGPSFGVLGDGGEVRALEGSPFGEWGVGAAVADIGDLKLLPPVEPTKVIGVGLNYVSHIEEMNLTQPSFPMLFMKPLAAVIGPGDPIVYPTQGQQVEYEAELAVVIGKQARRVTEEDALDYVLGYTCGNDVSERVIQRAEMAMGALLVGKGFDTFNPLGPVVATGLDPTDLAVMARVNGVERQNAHTSDLLFGVAELVSYISQALVLNPGDVIMSGTPAAGRPHRPRRRGGDRGRGCGRPQQSRRRRGVAAMLRSLLNIINPGPVSARVDLEDRGYGLSGSMKLSDRAPGAARNRRGGGPGGPGVRGAVGRHLRQDGASGSRGRYARQGKAHAGARSAEAAGRGTYQHLRPQQRQVGQRHTSRARHTLPVRHYIGHRR